MGQKSISRNSRPRNEYFVEVVTPDGLKHHVGPFKQLSRAKDWIAQNERAEGKKLERSQSV